MATAPATSDIESALCTACGLCCDGTLFGSIRLDTDDLALAARSPTPPVERDGTLAAPLPCGFLNGCECTVYAARYRICRGFRCKLLIDHAEGRVGPDAALSRIAETRQLRDAVRRAAVDARVAGTIPTIREASAAWFRDRSPPFDPAMATLDIRLVALDMQLTRHFGNEGRVSPK